jgi:hypothetical protein
MARMARIVAPVVLALVGLACAGTSADIEDPDLAPPPEAALVQEEPVFEPDEVIPKPDAPGFELIGEDDTPKGPTQKVEIEDEGSPEDQVVAQPKRKKSGSFMSGVKMNPNK